jgi:hypothetical protein
MKRNGLTRFEILFAGGMGALVLTGLASGCGDDFASCEETQNCLPGDAGAAGESSGGTSGDTTGGTAGKGGSSGSVSTGGKGGSTGGRGGSSGSSGSATGGQGGSGAPGGDGGMGGDGPDETAPTIVSVVPAEGATGVLANANLVVTFSEPMDRVTTQAAYQSADIPAAGVTFQWSAGDTVLTVNPNADLAYAAGASPSAVTARAFAASITNTAEDAAGNALAADFDWSFKTARRITQALPVVGHTGNFISGTPTPSFNTCIVDFFAVPVGDGGNGAVQQSFAEVDLASLPAGIIAWESAELSLLQSMTEGAPFPSLGELRVEHIRVNPLREVTLAAPSRHPLGTFPAAASPVARTANVVAALEDDYGEVGVSQIRVAFATGDNGNAVEDIVYFDCMEFDVEAVYLVP